MFTIKAKLNDGRSLSATVPGDTLARAILAVESKLPEGLTITSAKVATAGAGSLKITAARKPKAPAAEAPAAPAAPAAAPAAGKGKGK
jgi:hypothetical protein